GPSGGSWLALHLLTTAEHPRAGARATRHAHAKPANPVVDPQARRPHGVPGGNSANPVAAQVAYSRLMNSRSCQLSNTVRTTAQDAFDRWPGRCSAGAAMFSYGTARAGRRPDARSA